MASEHPSIWIGRYVIGRLKAAQGAGLGTGAEGRGATASRPFAANMLDAPGKSSDPMASVRPRTPRSGAPTRGCHSPPESSLPLLHLCTGRRPICTFAPRAARGPDPTLIRKQKGRPQAPSSLPRVNVSPCPRDPRGLRPRSASDRLERNHILDQGGKLLDGETRGETSRHHRLRQVALITDIGALDL